MIAPDTKNWTWVLQRRCPDCQFDASTCDATDVADLIDANARAWGELAGANAIDAARPDDQTWSALEYACHVRDVYRIYRFRIELMLNEDDPTFPNWDQDATALEDNYLAQDPTIVAGELDQAARTLSATLANVTAIQWQRSGNRSDGSSFTIDSIARYMIHDTRHHIWDVTGADQAL